MSLKFNRITAHTAFDFWCRRTVTLWTCWVRQFTYQPKSLQRFTQRFEGCAGTGTLSSSSDLCLVLSPLLSHLICNWVIWKNISTTAFGVPGVFNSTVKSKHPLYSSIFPHGDQVGSHSTEALWTKSSCAGCHSPYLHQEGMHWHMTFPLLPRQIKHLH